jgi:glycosyltransferase involved in cell wall biosynthesis
MAMNDFRVLLLRDPPEEERMSMERYADSLAQSLASQAGCSVWQLTPHIRAPDPNARTLRPLSHVTRLVRYPIWAARHRADLYHVADHGYAHATAFLPSDRCIVTAHDMMLLRAEQGMAGFRGTLRARKRFRWTVSFLRRVAHVICVTTATQQDVIDLAGVAPHRTTVVPNGVDERFRPLPARDRLRLREEFRELGDHIVVSVSTGNPYKNGTGVLRVVAALRRRGLSVGLARVGRDFAASEARLVEGSSLGEAVRWVGRVSDERLVDLYNAADVLLHPSYWEGFGWPPLEAMACGTPVVASTAPALREVIDEAGLLADPDDIELLADHVESILVDEAKAVDLRRRGRERAAIFTWGQVAERVAAVYDEVLSLARPQ